MKDRNYFLHNLEAYLLCFKIIEYTKQLLGRILQWIKLLRNSGVHSWMNRHSANILSRNFNGIGLDYARGEPSRHYWKPLFIRK